MARVAMGMAMIAGFGLLASAQAAAAQTPKAVALETRAQAAVEQLKYSAAADAFRRAAKARPAEDAEAVHDLQLAGLLYANVGRSREAQLALEAAGERALRMGDPAAAADAFTNAAMVAAERGSERASVLADRARRLAQMDEVSAGKRALIMLRLGPEAGSGAVQ